MILHVKQADFQKEVLEATTPVMVDFWATWCGPCKMQAPILEELAAEKSDLKICKIDVDENPDLAAQFQIMSIPTLMVFKNGKATATAVGLHNKNGLLALLAK